MTLRGIIAGLGLANIIVHGRGHGAIVLIGIAAVAILIVTSLREAEREHEKREITWLI